MTQKLGTWMLLVASAVVLAGVYGALHNQLTYTISPEYFTRFKFQQFAFAGVGQMPPRLGAAVVGVLATWTVGLIAGVLVATAGLAHRHPRTMARETLRAFGVVAAVALVAGLLGLVLLLAAFGSDEQAARIAWWRPDGLLAVRRFHAVGMMHTCGYYGGAIGIVAAMMLQLRRPRRDREAPDDDDVPAGAPPPDPFRGSALVQPMPRRGGMRRWIRFAIGAAAVLGAAALVMGHLVNVSVTEYYSSRWRARSSAEAETQGILRSRPIRPRRDFHDERAPLHVEDAWVEQVTRIEYRWLLFPVRNPRPQYRLVVRTRNARRGSRCDDRLFADTVRLGTDGTVFFASIDAPLPDTLRLHVVRGNPGCVAS